MPTEDPARDGLTNSTADMAMARSIAASTSVRGSMSTHSATEMPAACKCTLAVILSIHMADASTPEPTYGIPTKSRSPWMVPSSPQGPCRTGKTTSIASKRSSMTAPGRSAVAPIITVDDPPSILGRSSERRSAGVPVKCTIVESAVTAIGRTS